MLPSLAVLEKIAWKIKNIPNRKKENKRGIHFGCYLLCSKAGLRVSEAVSFDLANKTRSGLYRIEKPKGKKERLVYIPKKVIRELKKHSWKPNQTNRWNFYHFLRKIKRELNISEKVELTPHTLRHAFTTYHAESGLPLPLLQKLLGHSSIRTTALYWRNIYRGDGGNNDTTDILTGKNWLERPSPSQSKEPPKPPTTENFPEAPKNSAPIFIDQKPVISNKKPIQQDNSLLTSGKQEKNPAITNYQPKPAISEIQGKPSGKISLITDHKKQSKPKITRPLPLTAQIPTKKEVILLTKIKHLEEQLTQLQTENYNLTTQLTKTEQERDKLATIAEKENQRANHTEQQLQKIIQQLAQEKTKTEAKIIQPLPWKPTK